MQSAHLIHAYALDGIVTAKEITPAAVEELISTFQDVFQEPNSLPPIRDCNHRITLMPGSQPVNIRAYCHKPELTTEIE
jgi:hypothetical protein